MTWARAEGPSRREALRTALTLGAGLAAPFPLAHALGAREAARPGPAIAPYTAACVQTRVHPTWSKTGTPLAEALAANVATVAQAIERTAGETGARLIVFSEFCLQLPLSRLTREQWAAGAIRIPGPEIDHIARAARRAGAWVVVNPVEALSPFPGRYFLSGLLIGPDEGIALTYRKLYDLTSKTRPSDVLPQWLDLFGPQSLFPVADTPLGRMAVTIGADPVWPEMVRSLVFNGAEVIATCLASPNTTPSSPARRAADAPDLHDPAVPVMARRVRAYENMAYMLTTNLGPVGEGNANPLGAMQPSEIVDFHGNVLAASPDASERSVTAQIDIETLRRARCTPGPANTLVQLQTKLHAPGYARAQFDSATATPGDTATHAQRAQIASLVARGILVPPATASH